MATFFFSLIAFFIIMIALSIGLIISGKVLKKGCNVNPDETCPICHKSSGESCANQED